MTPLGSTVNPFSAETSLWPDVIHRYSTFSTVNIPGAIIADVTGLGALGNSGDKLSLWDGTGAGANLIDGSLTSQYPDLSTGNSGNSIEKIEESFPWSGSPSSWQEAFVPVGVNPAEFHFASPGRKNGTLAQGVTGLVNWSDYR